MVDVLENNDGALRSVIKIAKKCNKKCNTRYITNMTFTFQFYYKGHLPLIVKLKSAKFFKTYIGELIP